MKQILSTLLASTALLVAADFSMPAWSQTSNDQTTQTDKSEEDWRKSRKKTTTDDIFEDILNRRSTGSGYGMGPENPMDSLPEESRRHLMKQRAKVIATSDPGQPVTTPYTPSEGAKTDTDLQAQEKEAWDKLVKDMNGGPGQGQSQGTQQGQDGASGQGQGGQSGSQSGSQGSGQDGQSSKSDSSSTGSSSSPLRGGSSASVSDILAKIKGMQPGTGTAPQGSQTGSSNSGDASTSGQAPDGQMPNGQMSDGQGTTQSPGQDAGQGQDPSNSAAGSAQTNASETTQAAAQGADQAHSQAHAQTASPQSPLDRIQARKSSADAPASGKRTSASDYLKTSD